MRAEVRCDNQRLQTLRVPVIGLEIRELDVRHLEECYSLAREALVRGPSYCFVEFGRN